ncbi:hypothetical protein FOA52_013739 [Chlamydomonas sp. UWO 241]|nr:hypothetical protein FOA52_013739 [Chlamydomonas sp. UWO 241]
MMKTGNSRVSYACVHMTNSASRLSSAVRVPETSYVRVPMTILGNPKDFRIWSCDSSCLGASSDLTSKCSSAPSVAQSEQDECDITTDECKFTALYDRGDCHVVVSRRSFKEDVPHFDLSDLSDLASSYYPSNDPQQLQEEQVAERAEPVSISGIEIAAALHLSYQNDLGSSFYSSDEEAAADSDIEEEPQLLLLLLREVKDQAAERVQFTLKSAIVTALILGGARLPVTGVGSDEEEAATDAYCDASSYSSDEEQEQQQQEVEVPLDVSTLLANAQSAYQLSTTRCPATVLTYGAYMGGQMPLYAIIVDEQEDAGMCNSQIEWDEWQAHVAARATSTIKEVEAEEDEPCCAPMEECIVASSLANLRAKEEKQEDKDVHEWQLEADESSCWEERMVVARIVAALLPKLPAVESNLLHCSDAVCTHPASSLGMSAPSQPILEELPAQLQLVECAGG